MTTKIKLVFGDTASSMHLYGASDEEVNDFGSIQEFEFQSQAELAAFMKGVDATVGWMDYCWYQERDEE